MTNLAFDTHKFVKDLTMAEMPQAEALANHYASLLDGRLATKDDIKLLASNVGKDIKQLESKVEQLESNVGKDIKLLKSDIKQLASDGKNDIELAARGLWIKMLVAQFGMTGLIIGALGFLS